jgi:hypothetical protein
VPAASSLDGMLTGSVLAGPRTNVLMDEYWDIYEVFLR